MKRMLNKVSLFYKYLLSYLIVLLIPLTISGLFIYQHVVFILKDEVTASHRVMLEQIRDSVDVKFREMNKISLDISNKPELTPYQIKENMVNAMVAKKQLDFTVANDFIHKVLFYIRGHEYLYSASTTYTLPVFINDQYRYTNWTLEQFQLELDQLRHTKIRPAEDVVSSDLFGNRAITYMVPIPINGTNPYGTALFIIDEQTVQQLFRGILNNRSGNAVILDDQGQLITALYEEPYLQTDLLPDLVNQLAKQYVATIAIEGEEHLVSSVQSDVTGWTYMTLTPEFEVMKKVSEVKNRSIIVFVLILLVSSVVIYGLMFVNYSPIRKLFTYTGKRWGKAVSSINEVVYGIGTIADEKESLDLTLQTNRPAMQEYLLLQLLKGSFTDAASFHEKADENGLIFTKPCFCIVRLATRGSSVLTEAEITEISQILLNVFEGYPIRLMDEQILTYICAGEETEHWEGRLLEIHAAIRSKIGQDVTAGIGKLCREIDQIGKSFMEASTALDYKLIKGHDRVIFYYEVGMEEQAAYWYPKQEMEQLELFIRQANTEEINRVVDIILEKISGGSLPLHIVRCICYDLINCIIKATYGISSPFNNHYVPTHPDVIGLTEFDTVHDLAELVGQMCEELCTNIQAQQQKEATNSEEDFVSYIKANYYDSQFSLQIMADHFSVSLSYLKRHFKAQTNQTIMDYLNHYRLEQAKHLLRTTDIQLKELVQQIGYHDVSSFIRKFKQTVGITPGEFRKLHTES